MVIYACSDMGLTINKNEIIGDINIVVNEKDRIGIVGDNGAGKTTLIKLLTGQIEPTEGTISRYTKYTSDTGYLPQNAGLDSELSVYDEFLSSYSDLIKLEDEMAKLEQRLINCGEEEALTLSGRLDAMYSTYVRDDGLTYKSRIESILKGLGFPEHMWQLSISELSGGQKTRLYLGKLILRQPKILILDEPTNHLDTESIQWLEEEIKAYKGTLIIISHDRYFLNAVTSKTLLIENKNAYLYNAPYDKYIELRNRDRLYQERCYKQQQKQIAKIEAFIEKQRMWNRERNIIAAESRLKQLEKMTIIEKPTDADNTPVINFEVDKLGGKEVLDVDKLSFSYPDNELFEGLTFSVRRGERVFIQGPNGCGKSTLLKILTGNLEQNSGTYKIGANISFSYYAQDLSTLSIENTVFDEIFEHANRNSTGVNFITAGKIRSALAAFGFKGEDVFKQIADLSGGEKSRVAILKMAYDRSSLLFFDEPTNHLDIKTREVLESALESYEGTVIAVSHDRYFTNKLATRIINIPDYCQSTQETEEKDKSGGENYRRSRDERAEQRKRQALRCRLENEMVSISDKMDDIDSVISDPDHSGNYELVNSLYEEKMRLNERLEEIFAQLDALG